MATRRREMLGLIVALVFLVLAGTPAASGGSTNYTLPGRGYEPLRAGWSPPEIIDVSDGLVYRWGPDLAMDDHGNAMAVWVQRDPAPTYMHRIWARPYDIELGWGDAVRIDPGVTSVGIPKVRADGQGNFVTVWGGIGFGTAPYHIWGNRYVPGAGWAGAVMLDPDEQGDSRRPDVGVDQSGNAIAVWNRFPSVWSSRYVVGGGWGPPEPIGPSSSPDGIPRVAVDRDGNAVAVWDVRMDGLYRVFSNRYVLGQGWQSAAPIEARGDSAGSPLVVTDSAGTAFAAWTQCGPSCYRVDIRVSRARAGQGWEAPISLSTESLKGVASFDLAADGLGNAFAVWTQWFEGGPISDLDLWASRYAEGTGAWSSPSRLDGGGAEYGIFDPSVAASATGGAVVVYDQWTDTKAVHYAPGQGWGTPTIIEQPDGFVYTGGPIALAADPRGEAMTAWTQGNPGGTMDLYVSRFTAPPSSIVIPIVPPRPFQEPVSVAPVPVASFSREGPPQASPGPADLGVAAREVNPVRQP